MPDEPLTLDNLYQGDCLDLFPKVATGSVDLVFADPPFNIGYDYDVYHDRQSRRPVPRVVPPLGRAGGARAQTFGRVLAGHRRRVRR